MAQYKTGTISTTQGSNVITGNGTTWTSAGISQGDIIVIDIDTVPYYIQSVDSDTQITLTSPYPTTRTNATYVISRDYSPNYNYPLISRNDRAVTVLLRDFAEKSDAVSYNLSQQITDLSTSYKISNGDPTIERQGTKRFDATATATSLYNQYGGIGYKVVDTGTVDYCRINSVQYQLNYHTYNIWDRRYYDSNGNQVNRLWIGANDQRVFFAGMNPSTGSGQWDRELNYINSPLAGEPNWQFENPPSTQVTLIHSGLEEYPGWGDNKVWRDNGGLVHLHLVCRIATSGSPLSAGTVIANIPSNLRPTSNKLRGATARIDGVGNSVAANIYVLTTGDIRWYCDHPIANNASDYITIDTTWRLD